MKWRTNTAASAEVADEPGGLGGQEMRMQEGGGDRMTGTLSPTVFAHDR